jgi:hypothetical protein
MRNVLLRMCFAVGRLFSKPNESDAATSQAPVSSGRSLVIANHVMNFRLNNGGYEIENAVRDCLNGIAKAEGWSGKAPNWEYLYKWEARKDIPGQYKELSTSLRGFFEDRKKQLEKQKELREQDDLRQAIAKNDDLLERFYEITERKVSPVDEYGEENWEALDKETEVVLKKLEKRGVNVRYNWRLEDTLKSNFREYHEQRKAVRTEDVSAFSGVEFEAHVAQLLREQGYSVQGTPVTGDQGADLIARKDGRVVAIQAKRYAGTVGNRAVQEVVAAMGFYGAGEGWVVTNSTFTPQAKALAQKSNVRLFDGFDLKNNCIFY